MFNSSLTSSISGWFSGSSKEKSEETPNENAEPENSEDTSKNPDQDQTTKDSDGKEEGEGNEDASAPKSTLDKLTPTVEMQAKISEETQKVMSSALSFGIASEASKKVSEKVTETASTIKKTVEEKSIIGDLNREQEEFLQKKKERQIGDASVPPWVGYQESEAMKKQILALSTDKRNFLRNPPSGVQFNFDFDHHYPIAMATLKEDPNLEKMRFELVPKNAQLSTLAEMTRSGSEQPSSSASSTSSAVIIGSTNAGTISRSSSSRSLNKSDSENASATPKRMGSLDQLDAVEIDAGVGPEFVSDDFDPSGLNPDDLEREMKQLGMEDGNVGGEVPEWEKELQQELQDYEVIPGTEKDSTWEKEIEDMLSDEAQKQ